jgi:hypothetical protein
MFDADATAQTGGRIKPALPYVKDDPIFAMTSPVAILPMCMAFCTVSE